MDVLELEALLGPPDFAQALELDEREEFPQPLISRLVALGYPAWMVPVAHGGKLARFDQALSLQRCVARRA